MSTASRIPARHTVPQSAKYSDGRRRSSVICMRNLHLWLYGRRQTRFVSSRKPRGRAGKLVAELGELENDPLEAARCAEYRTVHRQRASLVRKMRILFHVPVLRQEENPALGVASTLVRRGHAVGWLAAGACPVGSTVEIPVPAGITNVLCKLREPDRRTARAPVKARVAARRYVHKLLAEIDEGEGLVDAAREVLRGFRPDVVVIDGYDYVFAIASHLEGVSYACLARGLQAIAPDDFVFPIDRHAEPPLALARCDLFMAYRMRPDFAGDGFQLSPELNVVFTTPELVGEAGSLPPETYLVGPSVRESRRQATGMRPLHEPPTAVGTVVVASSGDLADKRLIRIFANAAQRCGVRLIADPSPPLSLIRKAAASVVSGPSSLMDAMSEGVPFVLIPRSGEDAWHAELLKKSGDRAPALAVDDGAITTESVERALRAVLDPAQGYARNARRVGESYRRRNGAEEAADRILALGETRGTAAGARRRRREGSGPSERRARVALTFDDGPGPFTEPLLEVLRAADVKATFFALGVNIERFPDVALRIVREGHTLGNHTFSHVAAHPEDIIDEIRRTDLMIAELYREAGRELASIPFRLPWGPHGPAGVMRSALAQGLGRPHCHWTDMFWDWTAPPAAELLHALREHVGLFHDLGLAAIILLHDASPPHELSSNRAQTVEAVRALCEQDRNQLDFFLAW
jgi:peptidoglycan/xylan/chitin deacetylase (PgdA/CDA1 family)